MKVKLLLIAASAALCLNACGVAEDVSDLEVPDEDAIEMRTDPLYIEITHFEGRRINSSISFLEIENGYLTARIPTVLGLYDDPFFMTSDLALSFDRVSASVREPRAHSKGRGYSFHMTADRAYFFGEYSNAFWRFYIDVRGRRRVDITIESDTLTETGTYNVWHLEGKIRKDRTKGGTVILSPGSADVEFRY